MNTMNTLDLRGILTDIDDSEWRDAFEGDWQKAKFAAMSYVGEAPSREEAMLRANAALNEVAALGMDGIAMQGEVADALKDGGIEWQSRWQDDRAAWESYRKEKGVSA